MLTKKCDNCEKLVQAPDDAAGKKVKCPHCGDINTFPGAAAVASGPRAPSVGEAEQRVLRVRPEMFRARPLTFTALLAVLIAAVAGAFYFMSSSGNQIMGWVCVCAAVVVLGVFAVWKVKNLASSLEVTNKRTIERVGLFSRYTSEILHDDVRNVQITQSFVERIMGVGRIGISSAGQDGLEIAVKDIRSPDRIRETIDRYRPM